MSFPPEPPNFYTTPEVQAELNKKHYNVDRNLVFKESKIGSGFFLSLIVAVLPLWLFLYPTILPETFLTEVEPYFFYITVIAVVVLWAGVIVHNVWEMIKINSFLSGVGLFLGLITPIFWVWFAINWAITQLTMLMQTFFPQIDLTQSNNLGELTGMILPVFGL